MFRKRSCTRPTLSWRRNPGLGARTTWLAPNEVKRHFARPTLQTEKDRSSQICQPVSRLM